MSSLPLRVFGLWQAKQFFCRIGAMSAMKLTGRSWALADGGWSTSQASTRPTMPQKMHQQAREALRSASALTSAGEASGARRLSEAVERFRGTPYGSDLAEVEQELRATGPNPEAPTLNGAVMWAHLTRASLRQYFTDQGTRAALAFTVTCHARI